MPPPVTLKIKFKSTSISQFAERYSADVSSSGIFIRAKEPLPLGTHLRFEFQLADGLAILDGEGTVVWRREHDPGRTGVAAGMGVRFDRIAAGSQQALDQILTEKTRRGEGSVESRFDAGIRDAQAISGHTPSSPGEATPLPGGRPAAADEWLESDESTRVMEAEQSRQLAAKTRGPEPAGGKPSATAAPLTRPLPGDSWSQQATLADSTVTATLAARTLPVEATDPGPGVVAGATPPRAGLRADEPRPPGTLRSPPPPPRPKSARLAAVAPATAQVEAEPRQLTPAVVTAIPAEEQTLPDASAIHAALPASRPETPAPPSPVSAATDPPLPAAAPPIAPLPAPRSSRRGLLVFAGLIVAIAAAFLLLRNESAPPVAKTAPPAAPKPPPTQAPPPSTAVKAGIDVAVTTTPAGAALIVDEQAIAEPTPTRLVALDPTRTYQVTARRRGYLPQSVKLTPTAGASLAITLVEAERFLELTSLPPGAEVQLDGKRVGKTGASPLTIKLPKSPTGHQLALSLVGFADDVRTIAEGDDFAPRDGREVLTVAATLTRNPPKPLAPPGPRKKPAAVPPPPASTPAAPKAAPPGAANGEPATPQAPKPAEVKPAPPPETPKAEPRPGGEPAKGDDKTNIKVPAWMKQPAAPAAK